jgi:SM-20-related protein
LTEPVCSTIDDIVHQLQAQGWAQTSTLISQDLCHQLLLELKELIQEDQLRQAKIGHKQTEQRQPQIRGDYIHWLDNLNPTLTQAQFLAQMMEVGHILSRYLFQAFNAFECHYAYYPPGGRYVKHLDTFRDGDTRVLSLILYLNPDWQPEHGGALRIYNENAPSRIDTELEPRFGQMAIFLSRKIFHEVLPTFADRYSVTGWIENRPIQQDPLALVL